MKKVIFLDVDGVLNTPKFVYRNGGTAIDDILVDIVVNIVKSTNAEIVLSSSWRIDENDKRIVFETFKQRNIEIIDCTPWISQNRWVERNEEIRAWLDKNEVDKFAIIDDTPDANIPGCFFRTDENFGITVKIAEQVVQHLNSEDSMPTDAIPPQMQLSLQTTDQLKLLRNSNEQNAKLREEIESLRWQNHHFCQENNTLRSKIELLRLTKNEKEAIIVAALELKALLCFETNHSATLLELLAKHEEENI
jgi:HAD domain in Swiss Army Knife RNA repair proteins